MPYDHLILINDHLLRCAARDIKRLIITTPPRHGKSELVSRYTPAWWLGTYPDDQVILTSYGARLAAKWGREARNELTEYGPAVFGVQVAENPAASDEWEVADHEGIMVTDGIKGGVTGRGANLLVIDDPIKDAQTAQSAVERNKVWDWWLSTASTRLMPNGVVIVVQTRWHEDDFAGRLLAESGERWTLLELPALAEENDVLGRPVGEALAPEMFTREMLLAKKDESGPYYFAAMYQQKPAPPEGIMYKKSNFRYYVEHEPELIPGVGGVHASTYMLYEDEGQRAIDSGYPKRFQVVDVAASEKDEADYSVVGTFAVTDVFDLLVLDIARQHFDVLDVPGFLMRESDKHGKPPMWIETFGHGLGPFKALSRKGYPVRELKVEQGTKIDKVARSMSAIAAYERHKVFHLRGAEWLPVLEHELTGFPAGKNDDQVDVMAYAAQILPMLGVEEQPKTEQKGKPIGAGIMEMQF